MSVPRLMRGQGMIVATGAIGVPAEAAAMAAAVRADLALAPVMTATATYDHRVIQGAESGLLLRRLEQLLGGADGFYDEIFRSMRVPWRPFVLGSDEHERGQRVVGGAADDDGETQAKVWSLINAYRVRGSHLADLDPLEYRPDPLPSLDPASYGFIKPGYLTIELIPLRRRLASAICYRSVIKRDEADSARI
jgi:2-oxoglutarate dehydrogenase E1 component